MNQNLKQFVETNIKKIIQMYNIFYDEQFKDYSREQYYESLDFRNEFIKLFDYEDYRFIMYFVELLDLHKNHDNIKEYLKDIIY